MKSAGIKKYFRRLGAVGNLSHLLEGDYIIPSAAHAEVLNRKQIWQCATPKSASTYLSVVLENLWEEKACQGSPIPFSADRFQEPDIYTVYNKIRKSGRPYFTGHLHQRYTSFMDKFFLANQADLGGGVIVQSRDIQDTIVSLKDHLDKGIEKGDEGKMQWLASSGEWWPRLSDAEKFRLLAYYYAPWHFDFLDSWKMFPRRIEVTYDQVIKDTRSVVGEISSFFGIKVDLQQIDLAIARAKDAGAEQLRFNVGKSGRGEELLPADVQKTLLKIGSLVNRGRAD